MTCPEPQSNTRSFPESPFVTGGNDTCPESPEAHKHDAALRADISSLITSLEQSSTPRTPDQFDMSLATTYPAAPSTHVLQQTLKCICGGPKTVCCAKPGNSTSNTSSQTSTSQAGGRISLQFPPSRIRLQRGWLAMMQHCEVSK